MNFFRINIALCFVAIVALIAQGLDTPPDSLLSDHPPQQDHYEDDYFEELNGQELLDGFYLITGPFESQENAEDLIEKVKSKFRNSRIIINRHITKYFVVLYHSSQKDEHLAYASYKANLYVEEEAWIMHYTRQNLGITH